MAQSCTFCKLEQKCFVPSNELEELSRKLNFIFSSDEFPKDAIVCYSCAGRIQQLENFTKNFKSHAHKMKKFGSPSDEEANKKICHFCSSVDIIKDQSNLRETLKKTRIIADLSIDIWSCYICFNLIEIYVDIQSKLTEMVGNQKQEQEETLEDGIVQSNETSEAGTSNSVVELSTSIKSNESSESVTANANGTSTEPSNPVAESSDPKIVKSNTSIDLIADATESAADPETSAVKSPIPTRSKSADPEPAKSNEELDHDSLNIETVKSNESSDPVTEPSQPETVNSNASVDLNANVNESENTGSSDPSEVPKPIDTETQNSKSLPAEPAETIPVPATNPVLLSQIISSFNLKECYVFIEPLEQSKKRFAEYLLKSPPKKKKSITPGSLKKSPVNSRKSIAGKNKSESVKKTIGRPKKSPGSAKKTPLSVKKTPEIVKSGALKKSPGSAKKSLGIPKSTPARSGSLKKSPGIAKKSHAIAKKSPGARKTTEILKKTLASIKITRGSAKKTAGNVKKIAGNANKSGNLKKAPVQILQKPSSRGKGRPSKKLELTPKIDLVKKFKLKECFVQLNRDDVQETSECDYTYLKFKYKKSAKNDDKQRPFRTKTPVPSTSNYQSEKEKSFSPKQIRGNKKPVVLSNPSVSKTLPSESLSRFNLKSGRNSIVQSQEPSANSPKRGRKRLFEENSPQPVPVTRKPSISGPKYPKDIDYDRISELFGAKTSTEKILPDDDDDLFGTPTLVVQESSVTENSAKRRGRPAKRNFNSMVMSPMKSPGGRGRPRKNPLEILPSTSKGIFPDSDSEPSPSKRRRRNEVPGTSFHHLPRKSSIGPNSQRFSGEKTVEGKSSLPQGKIPTTSGRAQRRNTKNVPAAEKLKKVGATDRELVSSTGTDKAKKSRKQQLKSTKNHQQNISNSSLDYSTLFQKYQLKEIQIVLDRISPEAINQLSRPKQTSKNSSVAVKRSKIVQKPKPVTKNKYLTKEKTLNGKDVKEFMPHPIIVKDDPEPAGKSPYRKSTKNVASPKIRVNGLKRKLDIEVQGAESDPLEEESYVGNHVQNSDTESDIELEYNGRDREKLCSDDSSLKENIRTPRRNLSTSSDQCRSILKKPDTPVSQLKKNKNLSVKFTEPETTGTFNYPDGYDLDSTIEGDILDDDSVDFNEEDYSNPANGDEEYVDSLIEEDAGIEDESIASTSQGSSTRVRTVETRVEFLNGQGEEFDFIQEFDENTQLLADD